MIVIAIITITLLIIMGAFHFYWALGGTIGMDKVLPTKDGKNLMNPGQFPTFLVGLLLLLFALVAYTLQFDAQASGYIRYAGWVLSAIFFMRAVGDFKAVGFFKKIRSTEFAKYDTRYFSPLCVVLGVFFVLLSV